MSRERARRRAERQTAAERERAVRQRRQARLRRRRAWLARLVPTVRVRRTGRLNAGRRSERALIVFLALVLGFAVWALVDDLALRLAMLLLLVLVLPAVMVIALDRRN